MNPHSTEKNIISLWLSRLHLSSLPSHLLPASTFAFACSSQPLSVSFGYGIFSNQSLNMRCSLGLGWLLTWFWSCWPSFS